MHSSYRWAGTATLLVLMVGCGQDAPSAKKTPSPAPAKGSAAGEQVTLFVDGMS